MQDAGQADELAGQEGLVGGLVGDGHTEEVVGVAEHTAQLGDLVVAGHGGLELLHRIQVAG